MKGKFFKENIINPSTKQIKEIGELVNSSGSALIKLFSIKNIFTLSLILNIFSILIIVIVNKSLPEKIPFFYSRPWGTEQLEKKGGLFFIPISGIVFWVICFFLAKIFHKTEAFLSIMLGFFSLLFSIMGIITVINIIFVII